MTLVELAAMVACTGTGVGICGAIAWSALPLLTGQAAQNNKKAATPATADQDEGDGVKFGVMTVVGAIPLVNWSVSFSPCYQQRCPSASVSASCTRLSSSAVHSLNPSPEIFASRKKKKEEKATTRIASRLSRGTLKSASGRNQHAEVGSTLIRLAQ